MIYTSAIFANADESMVTGTDENGATETVAADHVIFRQQNDGPLGFLANGNTIAPYVAPPVTLPDLAPYQFKAMLALSGKAADLDAFIAALPEPDKTVARAKLDYSLTFRRDNDLVAAAMQALALSDAEMDALWQQASEIV